MDDPQSHVEGYLISLEDLVPKVSDAFSDVFILGREHHLFVRVNGVETLSTRIILGVVILFVNRIVHGFFPGPQ